MKIVCKQWNRVLNIENLRFTSFNTQYVRGISGTKIRQILQSKANIITKFIFDYRVFKTEEEAEILEQSLFYDLHFPNLRYIGIERKE